MVLNLNNEKDLRLQPTLLCINNGDPLSNKPIKNIKTNKGDKNTKPINENKKSKILITFLEPFF